MGVTPRRRTFAVAAIAAITAIGGLTACTKKNDEPSTPGEIKLVVDHFGEFGYDDLVKQYEQSHPGIKIELRKTAQLGDYRPKLVRYLATNKGAGDVVALEEGIITEFKANAANWVDLSQYVGDKSADYLPWKYEIGKTSDGKLLGLPTDVGGLAMCYRKDLLEAAGFPADRDAVSALWPTWDKFIEVGQQYRTKTGKGLLDTVTTAFSASLSQVGGDLFYDKDFNVVADTSPAVKQSWDLAVKLADAKVTAKTNTWSAEWQAGFQQGTFAATLCPSWMLGIIEQNSGAANKGKWDVAAVPGGGGNWGGSWLSVPTQSKHPKEAAELAAFLTNADSQVAAFKAKGPLPSNLKALDNADFQAYQNAYFNNAPVGKIFGEGAKTLKPVTIGPKHSSVKERAFEPALQAYEAGRLSAQAAWDQAIKDAKVQGAF
ncbi:extracellular solute-binding protein [Catellatospora sp. KI3]|uniref:ABC transporter substrate-binding protein n=1 Tax=Catellatospora sp. KI3 TaxID=3041620 RepID=UPI0024823615|nr:extracellular solute-binding protein [Catellatospora sp. KI3]MDI1461977.1 extracellular solute-binding protein [Catellatospora sp. KI3]